MNRGSGSGAGCLSLLVVGAVIYTWTGGVASGLAATVAGMVALGWLAPAVRCEICGNPLMRARYTWRLDGRKLTACPHCNTALARDQSRRAMGKAPSIVLPHRGRPRSWAGPIGLLILVGVVASATRAKPGPQASGPIHPEATPAPPRQPAPEATGLGAAVDLAADPPARPGLAPPETIPAPAATAAVAGPAREGAPAPAGPEPAKGPPRDPLASLDALRSSLEVPDFEGQKPYRVILVADPTTVVLKRGEEPELRVRLAGVDGPDAVHRGDRAAEEAKQAHAFLKQLVAERLVHAESDESRPVDRARTPLVYLYRKSDGLFVNAEVIGRGHAVASEDAIVRSTELLRRFQGDAEANARGLWAPSRPTPASPVGPAVAAPAADPKLPGRPSGQAVYLTTRRVRRFDTAASKMLHEDRTEWHRPNCILLDDPRSLKMTSIEAARERFAECETCKPGGASDIIRSAAQRSGGAASPAAPGAGGSVHVRGYHRKDGTYVRSHTRRK